MEKKAYKKIRAAARKGKNAIVHKFKINDEKGIQYIATARAIRSFAADVFESSQDAAMRYRAARDSGVIDKQAKSDLLYWSGLFDPIMEQLNLLSHKAGLHLADMKKEPWGEVMNRAVDEETIDMVLNETARRLRE